jgi:hypothetical protein
MNVRHSSHGGADRRTTERDTTSRPRQGRVGVREGYITITLQSASAPVAGANVAAAHVTNAEVGALGLACRGPHDS